MKFSPQKVARLSENCEPALNVGPESFSPSIMIASTAANVASRNSRRKRVVPLVPIQNEKYARLLRADANPGHAREYLPNQRPRNNSLNILHSKYLFNPNP